MSDLEGLGVDPAGRRYIGHDQAVREAIHRRLTDDVARIQGEVHRASHPAPVVKGARRVVKAAKPALDQPLYDANGSMTGLLRGGKFVPVLQPDAKATDPDALIVCYDQAGRPVGTAPAKALTRVKAPQQPGTTVAKAQRTTTAIDNFRRLRAIRPAGTAVPAAERRRRFEEAKAELAQVMNKGRAR